MILSVRGFAIATACVWSLLCAVAEAATLPAGFTERLVVSGLTNPTAMAFAPDGRLFVCLQGGQVRVIKNGWLLNAPFLELIVNSVGERGVLGIAFDPAFSSNQYVYVYYTTEIPNIHNRVSRFTAGGDVAILGSELVLIDLNAEPLSGSASHNGGAIHFGQDGKLYVAIGDNGIGPNSQSLDTRLGKVLRLNADGTIPSDNPFFGTATGLNRAIWALGLRNPFTFAVQPGSGRIFINDVGEGVWEEINDGVAGANFGWPNCEGPNTRFTETPCSSSFAAPLFAYDRRMTDPGECAIAGGAFYNPQVEQFPAADVGAYFFADLCGGWIRKRDPATGNVTDFAAGLSDTVDLKVSSDGSLYYLSRTGVVVRINYAAPGTAQPGALHDFDGNGTDDLALYTPATGTWRVRGQFDLQFGFPGDLPVPGDYDGDGTTDVAVYRTSTGQWFVRDQPTLQFGDPGDIPVPGDYDGNGSTDLAVYRPSTGTWYVRNQFGVQFGGAGFRPVPADYDGNGTTDVAVYRGSSGHWFVRDQFTVQFGDAGDLAVPADYNGDGTTDLAVYRRSTGVWYVRNQFAVQFGDAGDIPVPRDYNGDHSADVAVYRRATGQWFVRNVFTVQFGQPGDVPVPRPAAQPPATPGDYDGDVATDVAVFRPSTSTWLVRGKFTVVYGSAAAGDSPVPADYNGDGVIDVTIVRDEGELFWRPLNQLDVLFGFSPDLTVPGDYDGDGAADCATYRESTGEWFVRHLPTVQFGDAGDVPIPGDYDGDGMTDLAVYRPSTGQWFVRNQFVVQFGDFGDVPIPADYNGDGVLDIAVYRPSTGQWFVRNQFVVQFGDSGDVAVPGDYNGDGRFDIAVYRPPTGTWYVRNQAAVQFGQPGDIPVVR